MKFIKHDSYFASIRTSEKYILNYFLIEAHIAIRIFVVVSVIKLNF